MEEILEVLLTFFDFANLSRNNFQKWFGYLNSIKVLGKDRLLEGVVKLVKLLKIMFIVIRWSVRFQTNAIL